MDLFQVARDNAESFSHRYEGVRDAVGAAVPRLEQFVALVQSEGRLAVNRRPKDLLRFLALEGRLHTAYELAAKLESRSGQPKEELLRLWLADYYDRRMAFDRFLEQGERFRYGALNVGGLGVVFFGEYCLIFRETFAEGLADLAYLWANSLETYLLPGRVVDEARLQSDACPYSHRHLLAALKHGRDAAYLAEDRWPALVCSRDDFIEAIFVGSPVPSDLQAVRMDRFDYELYSDYMADAALGGLSDYDRQIVDDFDVILSLLEKHSIPLETVAA